jgi:hypothetical protein
MDDSTFDINPEEVLNTPSKLEMKLDNNAINYHLSLGTLLMAFGLRKIGSVQNLPSLGQEKGRSEGTEPYTGVGTFG